MSFYNNLKNKIAAKKSKSCSYYITFKIKKLLKFYDCLKINFKCLKNYSLS